jgi:hypothetical protein
MLPWMVSASFPFLAFEIHPTPVNLNAAHHDIPALLAKVSVTGVILKPGFIVVDFILL